MTDNPFREHIRAVLDFEEYLDQGVKSLIAEYRAKGYRIVDVIGKGRNGKWSIFDYHTREPLLEGGGGYEGSVSSVREYSDTWVHIESITDEVMGAPDPITPGLPESLCEALTFWVRNQASDEDTASVLGEIEPGRPSRRAGEVRFRGVGGMGKNTHAYHWKEP